MKLPTFISILIVFLLSISGCKKNSDNLIINPSINVQSDSLSVPLSPIDSKLSLTVIEQINTTGRDVQLICNTLNVYSPAGSQIISKFSFIGNSIKLNLERIVRSECGAAIFSPATVKYDLDAVPNGIYSLEVTINSEVLMGMLKVDDGSFEFKIQPNNIINFYPDTLLRVPLNVIWGQAESIKPGVYQTFLDTLAMLGAQPNNLKPGYYYYFDINKDGTFNIHSTLNTNYGKFFLYKYNGDANDLRNLIKRFAKNYQDSIYIQLNGGKGEAYYSTVLKYEP